MTGVSDLSVLLRTMKPRLFDQAYGIVTAPLGQAVNGAFARIAEEEGETLVAEEGALLAAGLLPGARWARISLIVHSDLAAVGLTAAFAAALSAKGISANVIAGYFHDHIFVQWERRYDALAALEALSDA